MPDRFFNTLFVISPKGEVVHRAAKNHLWCRERSCTPHDVYDRWVELFGDGIDAFYPVLRDRRHRQPRHDLLQRRRVPRGRARARVQRRRGRLPAQRGRPDDERRLPGRRHVDAPEPRPRALQQRVRAGAERRPGVPASADAATRSTSAAGSRTSSTTWATSCRYSPSGYNTFVTGTVDIEALRQFRVMNLNSNWMKDLRTEVFRRMYERADPPDEPVARAGPEAPRARSTRSTGRTSSG